MQSFTDPLLPILVMILLLIFKPMFGIAIIVIAIIVIIINNLPIKIDKDGSSDSGSKSPAYDFKPQCEEDPEHVYNTGKWKTDKDIYILSDDWKHIRSQVLKRDNHSCQICKSNNNLNVHHIEYPLEHRDVKKEQLVTLCRTHHKKVHKAHKWNGYDHRYYIDILQ